MYVTVRPGDTARARAATGNALAIVLAAGGGATFLPAIACAPAAGNITHADADATATTDTAGETVDLFINVRVSNGHPKALDTILRIRFTVGYVRHEPSALNTWNTRASTAAAGVIQSGVVGDAPEGGKEQHEDTTVVAP